MENVHEDGRQAPETDAMAEAPAHDASSGNTGNTSTLRSTDDKPQSQSQSQRQYERAQHDPRFMEMTEVAGALPDATYQDSQSHPYSHPDQIGAMNPAFMYTYQSPQYQSPSLSHYPPSFQQPFHMYQNHRPYNPYQGNITLPQPAQLYSNPQYMLQNMSPNHLHSQYQHYQQYQKGQTHGQMAMSGYAGGNSRNAAPQGVPILMSHNTQSIDGQEFAKPGHPTSSVGALRGPPRKPKQSGHALWVGNLPPMTNIIDLKEHFAQGATNDIESVFLISKSNCAFVNYRTDASCTAAMNRFHDSRFQGVRLVCRLRRGSAPLSVSPSGSHVVDHVAMPDAPAIENNMTPKLVDGEDKVSKVLEKFFIIKSLTVEDLERSVYSGIWATQSHNEAALNKAFQAADNVYLIFSANKSGEYFGYARMESIIDDEAAAAVEKPAAQISPTQDRPPTSIADLPLKIFTPATATAPEGHIIDDSARGTIFWEAANIEVDGSNLSPGPDQGAIESGSVSGEEELRSPIDVQASTESSPAQSSTYGRPFKITWQSTDRLPFYRTRGLRNPWNSNREVKIARDGTELEPSVGRKLIGMFGVQVNVVTHSPVPN